jgi:hypothetical protein
MTETAEQLAKRVRWYFRDATPCPALVELERRVTERDRLAAENERLRVALARAAHLGSHLVQQVPEFTGVIGPEGQREDDYIRDNIGQEFQRFAALVADSGAET